VNVEAPADGVKTVFRGHENIIKPQIARISPIRPRSPIPVQETRQLFFRTHNVTLSSPQCASAIQIVRPAESRTDTQPQLHPVLLRLSAIISHYFISAATKRSPNHWQQKWKNRSRSRMLRLRLKRKAVSLTRPDCALLQFLDLPELFEERSEESNLPEVLKHFARAPFAFTRALLCGSLLCGSLLCGSLLRHNALNLLSLVDLTRLPKLHAPCKQFRNDNRSQFAFGSRRFCLFCSPHGNDKMIERASR